MKILIIFCRNHGSRAPEIKSTLTRSDCYAILHGMNYKKIFGTAQSIFAFLHNLLYISINLGLNVFNTQLMIFTKEWVFLPEYNLRFNNAVCITCHITQDRPNQFCSTTFFLCVSSITSHRGNMCS